MSKNETLQVEVDTAKLLDTLCERIKTEVKLDKHFEDALQTAVQFGIITKQHAEERKQTALRERKETVLRDAVSAIAEAVFGDGIALYGLVLRDSNGKVVAEIVAPDWSNYRMVVVSTGSKSGKRSKNYSPEFVALAQDVCQRLGNTWFGISSFVRSGRMMEEALKEATARGIPIYLPEQEDASS